MVTDFVLKFAAVLEGHRVHHEMTVKVEKLGIMKESGLITDEEFAAMKAELLKNIL